MKYAFASAALMAFVQAYGDEGSYPDQYVLDAPEGMPESRLRYREVNGKFRFGKTGADYKKVEKKCRRAVKEFDAYCHNAG